MSCNQCCGIEQQFDDAEAVRALRRYLRRGPDTTTRLLIEDVRALLGTDTRGLVLLDIGAGIGVIHHELLDTSVSRALHLDASPAHIAVARKEAERRGHAARVDFVRADFVSIADTVAPADVVTLDRVICCYHDMHGLVGSSAGKARQYFGAVYPRDGAWVRAAIAVVNLVKRIRRSAFRVYFHHPSSIDRELGAAGLQRVSLRRTLMWEVVVYARRSVSDPTLPHG